MYKRQPWRDLAGNVQVQATIGYERTGQQVKTGIWATHDFDRWPSGAVGNLMFNAPDARDAGLGLNQLRFFDPANFGGTLLHADNDTERCNLRDQLAASRP